MSNQTVHAYRYSAGHTMKYEKTNGNYRPHIHFAFNFALRHLFIRSHPWEVRRQETLEVKFARGHIH